MITPGSFFNSLTRLGLEFFVGVPDSLLKELCKEISNSVPAKNHVIAANEGGAIGLAVGYHLATGKIPVVYMQNSGLGNAVNPLLSLADSEVYSIPMLIVIGWRGEPDIADEPQHLKQGKLTLSTLNLMAIEYVVISADTSNVDATVSKLIESAIVKSRPVALVIKKNTFSQCQSSKDCDSPDMTFGMSREAAIRVIVDHLRDEDFIVSTTGMASRELFEYRKDLQHGHANDFLTVGGMGHASQIATGIAMSCPDRQIFCIDGDGAVLMHLGALAISGQSELKNFKHIIINNGAHDSVGGQPTLGQKVNLSRIASECGYKVSERKSRTVSELAIAIDDIRRTEGPALLEVFVDKGSRKNLGRPTSTPLENKISFMRKLNGF